MFTNMSDFEDESRKNTEAQGTLNYSEDSIHYHHENSFNFSQSSS
jgi:hypothetical protein